MISFIQGTVIQTTKTSIILEVGNFGLQIHVPNSTTNTIGSKLHLFTYLHWNQEQGPTLFGFLEEIERTVFLLVIECSGVGPKLGLAILQDLGAQRFLQAIQQENEKELSSVSGIGAKKAEQIIVHLKHKVAALLKSGIILESAPNMLHWNQISEVLASLNYSKQEIAYAMTNLAEKTKNNDLPFDQLMRYALSFLAKKSYTEM